MLDYESPRWPTEVAFFRSSLGAHPTADATKKLFGEYEQHAENIDCFMSYQTVADELRHEEWRLQRLRATNAAHGARSSLYGGICECAPPPVSL